MFAGFGQRIETSSRIVGNLCSLPGKRRTVGNGPTLLVGICFHSSAVVARASEKTQLAETFAFQSEKEFGNPQNTRLYPGNQARYNHNEYIGYPHRSHSFPSRKYSARLVHSRNSGISPKPDLSILRR